MELMIDSAPACEATIDMVEFRTRLAESLDVQSSLDKSLTEHNGSIDRSVMLDLLYDHVDWKTVMRVMLTNTERVMHVQALPITFRDKVSYAPKETSHCGLHIQFVEHRKSGSSFIFIHSFVPHMDSLLNEWFKQNAFEYGSGEKWMMNLE